MSQNDNLASTTVNCYEIVVRGIVGPSLAGTLDGFSVVSTNGGESLLRGRVHGPAGLQAALETLASIGLELTALRSLPIDR